MGIWRSHSQCSIVLCTPSSSEASTRLLDYYEPMISSMSLDRISLSESLPQFPSGHRPPFFTLMHLKHYPTFRNRDSGRERDQSLVTVPTSPRMRVVLEEKIAVNTWTASVNSQLVPPCHVPWEGLTSEQVIRSPNSIEECEQRLSRSLRLLRRVKDLGHKSSDRLLLVKKTRTATPKHYDFTLDSGIFRAVTEAHKHAIQLEDKQERTKSSSSAKAINVLPIFSPSSCSRNRNNPMTSERMNLAVRRGHKAFPVLEIDVIAANEKREPRPHDSIPAAFRGSPTVDSRIIYQDQDFVLSNLPQLISTRCRQELENLRSSLPIDWLYRPLTTNSDSKQPMCRAIPNSSRYKKPTREWAFAEPLMDMIDDFSAKIDRLRSYNDNLRGNEVTSRYSWRYRYPYFDSTSHKYRSNNSNVIRDIDGLSANVLEVEWRQPRPCLVSSLKPGSEDTRPKKSVRFARLPPTWRRDSTTTSDEGPDSSFPSDPIHTRHKRPSVTLSGVVSPQLPLPRILHPEPMDESRCVTDLNSNTTEVPLSLELSYSHHISDLSTSRLDTITRDKTRPIKKLSPLKESFPSVQSKVNEPPNPAQANTIRSHSHSLTTPKDKTFNKASKISNHLARVTVPRPRRNENDVRREEGAVGSSVGHHLKTPLRNIFTKLK